MIDGAQLARHSVATILEGLADGVMILDAADRLIFANDAAARICGFPDAAALLAVPFDEVRAAFEVFDADGAPVPYGNLSSRARSDPEAPQELLVRCRRSATGQETWTVLKARTIADAEGRPQLVVKILRDVTQRMLNERAQAEHAAHLAALNERLTATVDALREKTTELERARAALEEEERHSRFLAEAGELLSRSLDYESTLNAVAALAVPGFAEHVSVDLLDETGRVRRVAVRATDPELERTSLSVSRQYPIELNRDSAATRVFATGEAVFLPEFDTAAMRSWARGEEHFRTMQRFGLRSTIIAPLSGNDGVFGIVCFGCTSPDRRFTERDFAFACELARRMALAITNASLYRDAQTARIAAEHASRAKSQFLAVMSHELRTPLNGVLGYADLLTAGVGGELNDVHLEYVHRISRSGRHLLELVEQVLGHARAESTHEEPHLQAADARTIAREAATVIEAQVALRELSLRIELPDAPVPMWTDAGKVRQILLNLLNNAVKFTPAGTIVLRVASGTTHVRFDVEDTGIGVPADQIEHIFEPFAQLDQSTTRAAGGVGLGLAVSRRLATLLGGTLICRSELSCGSVFTLTLPRHTEVAASR
jgi:signal transduction histidine kinase